MKKTKPKLLATSPTKEGIVKMVNKFFYSESYSLGESVDGVYPLLRSGGTAPTCFRVVETKRGFRFEDVDG